jgi:hypothetical protein
MARHLRIPGLIDLFTADEAASIRSLDAHPRIDRVFDKEGPLVTRVLRGRIRSVFHIDGRLWPAFLPRGDEGRRKDSEALHIRLSGNARRRGFDAEALERLAVLLVDRDADRPVIGEALQQAVGRAFNQTFHATRQTYDAADVLANWPQAGIFKALALRLSGALRRARRTILEAARGDPYCAHAISLALPNMIATFERMRAMRLVTSDPAQIRSDAAAARSLRGPKTLIRGVRPLALPPDPRLALRTPNVKIDVPETRKPLRRGAIVRFDRGDAQSIDRRLVFSEGGWAACPARDWVPDLFAEIWRRSLGKDRR